MSIEEWVSILLIFIFSNAVVWLFKLDIEIKDKIIIPNVIILFCIGIIFCIKMIGIE